MHRLVLICMPCAKVDLLKRIRLNDIWIGSGGWYVWVIDDVNVNVQEMGV